MSNFRIYSQIIAVLTFLRLFTSTCCQAINCTAVNNDISVNGSVPGVITSPKFPDKYPTNLQCTWRITASEGKIVKLTLKNMTFGDGDYVIFRDGILDTSPQIAKYAHCAQGELVLYSTDRYMLVNFFSDLSDTKTGFQLNFEFLDSNTIDCSPHTDTCLIGQTLRNTSAVLRSLGFPKSLPEKLDCSWTIQLPISYRVLLQFFWFGIAGKGDSNSCTSDVFATDVDSSKGSYCGCYRPPDILSSTTTVEIMLSTNQAANHTGFLAFYRAVGPDECKTGGARECPMNLPRGLGTNLNGDICYELEITTTTGTMSTAAPSTTFSVSKIASTTSTPKTEVNPESGAEENVSRNAGILIMITLIVSSLIYL